MAEENKNNLPRKRKTNAPAPVKRIKAEESKRVILARVAKRFFSQFGTAILSVAVVAYVFLQLMLNVGTLIDTEPAEYASVTESSELEAFIFRNEKLVPAGAVGTNCFIAADGQKVRRGENVAITYSDPKDVETQQKINKLDERISVLEKSNLSVGASTTNVALLDAEINELVLSIVRRADTNDFEKLKKDKEALLVLMNRREAIIKSHSYSPEISALYRERADLTKQLTGTNFVAQSPVGGYFYSDVDGYENIFTMDKLENLTSEEFETLADSLPDENVIKSSAGKVVVGSTWYMAVSLDKRTAEEFREGRNYTVRFQYSDNKELKMTLERKLMRSNKDMTVLIFSSKLLPENFDYTRCQTVELPHGTHEGLRIRNEAIRIKDGVTGVYVVAGSKIAFKKITVLYNYGSYSICALPINPAYPDRKDVTFNSPTELSLHDAVVTGGEEVYDGKRLN